MRTVGIVVGLSTWRATVHYTDCHYYRARAPRRLPLPRTIPFKLCSYCRPTEDDVRAAPPEASWYAWSPRPEARREGERLTLEHADQVMARQQRGYGRTFKRATGWTP